MNFFSVKPSHHSETAQFLVVHDMGKMRRFLTTTSRLGSATYSSAEKSDDMI